MTFNGYNFMNETGKFFRKFFTGDITSNMTTYEGVDNLGSDWYVKVGQKMIAPLTL